MPVANERGLALIVAVAILLVFAVVTAVLVSLVSTDSDMALYQFRSGEATYIANGGMQYAMMNYQNYPNFSIPPFSARGATPQILLGSGGFTVDSPGVLSAAVTAAAATIPAVCFDRGVASVPCNTLFPPSGRILVESELIDYTGVTAASFTGAARGRDGSLAVSHSIDRGIYLATGLVLGITNAAATVMVGSTTGFTIPGTIKIDQEYLYCSGRTAITFTGCTRGIQGSRAMAHNALATAVQVTMTVNATVPTGITGNAQRIVKGEASVYLDGWIVGNVAGGGFAPAHLRWNGINWDNFPPQLGVSQNFNSIFALDIDNDGATDDGWAVGNFEANNGQPCTRRTPNIFRFSNGAWTCTNNGFDLAGPDDRINFNSVHAVANNDVWIVGDYQNRAQQSCPATTPSIFHWNGAAWACVNTGNPQDRMNLNSVYAVLANEVWMVGDTTNQVGATCGNGAATVFRYTGGWSCQNGGAPAQILRSIVMFPDGPDVGALPDDGWAVGDRLGVGTNQWNILDWNGGAWVRVAANIGVTAQNLNSVFMISQMEGWAVGNRRGCAANGPTILRYFGGAWACSPGLPAAPDEHLNSISCASSVDCWAVGNNGAALHWDGVSWTRLNPAPTGNRLNEVFLVRPQNFMRIGDWQEVY